MDNNQFKGNWHEFKGEVKRKWGKITDNDLLECEGDYEKFLGIARSDTVMKRKPCRVGRTIGIPSGSKRKSVEDTIRFLAIRCN